ncbi:hypothetical protein LOK49_LG15G00625 [Camellia lanceoleosa]|uniref:Uncharacterized protein n=1 Tax=Camellia lanceoleosa TaxID=1840588 RepID=A0ACC0F5U8_9ERIC|nr:hypothetical protein LOK49_LG15G00625 [Camellia lanceoleosa]
MVEDGATPYTYEWRSRGKLNMPSPRDRRAMQKLQEQHRQREAQAQAQAWEDGSIHPIRRLSCLYYVEPCQMNTEESKPDKIV